MWFECYQTSHTQIQMTDDTVRLICQSVILALFNGSIVNKISMVTRCYVIGPDGQSC